MQHGEIRIGKELGKKIRCKYQWLPCPDCKEHRWVQLKNGLPAVKRCVQCHLKNLNTNRVYLKTTPQERIKKYPRRFGANNWHWKGGRIERTDGYVMVYVSPDDFFYPMCDKRRYVMEHRLVMAKHFQRCLLPWEVVHHKNSIRSDNRLENLELFPSSRRHDPLSKMTAYTKKLEREIEKLRELLNANGIKI